MNDKKLNLEQRRELEQQSDQLHREQSVSLEFETVEQALSHDAGRIEVPPRVAERLAESIRNEPPGGPWWKKWF